MDLQLDHKNALITGSSRGTGAVIARALAKEGVHVFVHGAEPHSADEVASAIRDAGGSSDAVSGDICCEQGADGVAKQVLATGHTIDILINNYGAAAPGTWDTSTDDHWTRAYETNLMSAIRMVRHFSPPMKENGWGRIVQLGTIGSTRPGSRMPGYYAAKAALSAATVSLAKELKETGITVNIVSPGLIRTPEVEAYYLARGQKKGWGSSWEEIEPHIVACDTPNPVGRIARREEIADLVTFLCSPRAGYINGQNIRIDGGAVDIVT